MGFGYLDTVRRAFSNSPKKHTDLTPADIDLGPYDSAYKGGDYPLGLSSMRDLRADFVYLALTE